MTNKTINYYNKNFKTLNKKYQNANMKTLYNILDQYTHSQTKLLEIGFGSGRDLVRYLHQNIDIVGVDASKAFVNNFKKAYPEYKTKVVLSTFPYLQQKIKDQRYDIIYSISSWMHISQKEYKNSIRLLKQLLKKNGIFLLSYSTTKRIRDPRFFEELQPRILQKIFQKSNFRLIYSSTQTDIFNRKIKWTTQVFQLL